MRALLVVLCLVLPGLASAAPARARVRDAWASARVKGMRPVVRVRPVRAVRPLVFRRVAAVRPRVIVPVGNLRGSLRLFVTPRAGGQPYRLNVWSR
jgi:hypothetical protein